MKKSINLRLNRFPAVPYSLRDASTNLASPAIDIELANLFHHYYLDTFDCTPPSPDPAQFEAVQFLSRDHDFRFLGRGFGTSTQARRNRSSELGQAMCRMFLHDHLGIKYFAHISNFLPSNLPRALANYKVKKIRQGDAPDYLCARNEQEIFLAEAKGRYESINFSGKAFDQWRQQFETVEILDPSGIARAL